MTRPPERLVELSQERAVFGLYEEGARDFDTLVAAHPDFDAELDELAAAATYLALGAPGADEEPLPAALRQRVLAAAARELEKRVEGSATDAHAFPAQRAASVRVGRSAGRRSSGYGWLAAAAAILALVGWWPRLIGAPGSTAPDARTERETILARADVVRVAWAESDFAPGASGDVVWSQGAQEGVMRIAGLPANDPTERQYQLWIFDAEQEHPVDGGVFDIAAGADELLIPIDAKIAVGQPTMFAVTVEKPGGVVVSKRETIALLAPLE
jgi:hypothetical protein